MAGAVKRKKLVFATFFAGGSLNPVRVFPLTQFRPTQSYTGDLWGNVLDDLVPLTVGSPGWKKQLSDVTAWARLVASDFADPFGVNSNTSTSSLRLALDFVSATTNSAAATLLSTTNIKTSLPISGLQTTLGFDGATPIMSKHFGIRLTKRGSAAGSTRVMVYVARNHSFEA